MVTVSVDEDEKGLLKSNLIFLHPETNAPANERVSILPNSEARHSNMERFFGRTEGSEAVKFAHEVIEEIEKQYKAWLSQSDFPIPEDIERVIAD